MVQQAGTTKPSSDLRALTESASESFPLYQTDFGGFKLSISNNVPNSIPFLDLVTPHVELEQELTEVFRKALRTAGFIGGPMVEEFEKAFATFCDVKHSVAVSSGTDALRFALMASGVKPGDVVVTVPHTFIATTEAISQAGALARVRGHRRADLQHGSREAGGVSGKAVHR